MPTILPLLVLALTLPLRENRLFWPLLQNAAFGSGWKTAGNASLMERWPHLSWFAFTADDKALYAKVCLHWRWQSIRISSQRRLLNAKRRGRSVKSNIGTLSAFENALEEYAAYAEDIATRRRVRLAKWWLADNKNRARTPVFVLSAHSVLPDHSWIVTCSVLLYHHASPAGSPSGELPPPDPSSQTNGDIIHRNNIKSMTWTRIRHQTVR